MVTSQDEQAVKDFLSRIVEGDLSVLNDEDFGLCYNLSRYIYAQHDEIKFVDCYFFIFKACESWRHYSGNRVTPIPTAATLYKVVKYEGEQLELRQSLAQHLLDTFEEFKHVLGEAEKV